MEIYCNALVRDNMQIIESITELKISKSSRVLILMPHPDDEAVFTTGLILFLHRNNIPLKVITLTKGEASSLRFGLKPNEDLSKARVKEQKRAFTILKVKDYDIKNIPDGQIENNKTEIKNIIQTQIKSFKPTHLVTLEPDGIYGHPDHVALSRFVTQTCKSPLKLLYATVCPHFVLPKSSRMAKIAKIEPIPAQFQLNLALSDIIIKLKTLNAHGSQFRNFWHLFGTAYVFLRNKMLFREYFTYYEK